MIACELITTTTTDHAYLSWLRSILSKPQFKHFIDESVVKQKYWIIWTCGNIEPRTVEIAMNLLRKNDHQINRVLRKNGLTGR